MSKIAKESYDAVVIGAGPNGLAAAIVLAQAGRSVLILEAKLTVGGGTRSMELTLPGFVHDVCSAIHPLGLGSPFFRTLPLEKYGLEWIEPPAALAHPLDDGRAVILYRSIQQSANTMGWDAKAYSRLMQPLVQDWETKLAEDVLAPIPGHFPRHPFSLARFGLSAILPAQLLADWRFKDEAAKAVIAGLAAHSMLQLSQPLSAAAGILLGTLAHAVGWPLPKGGSQNIAEALAAYFRDLGGEIVTDYEVKTWADLPPARDFIFDLTPRQLLKIAGEHLPPLYRQRLRRYRYGPGIFKLDLALDGPIPWQAPEVGQAGTVHLGGTLAEIALSERAVALGQLPEKPYVLLAQPSLFDGRRAPADKHTVWAYCHVPAGSTFDMSERILNQLERFAPGVRERILASHKMNSAQIESYNPNYIGGDINGGVQDLGQQFGRPVLSLNPYKTGNSHIFICSSSTPPGGGVHGMCGYYAAQAVLQ